MKRKDILFFTNRFDLMAKFLYIESYDKKYETDFYKKLYENNIYIFNGCKEPIDPTNPDSKAKNNINDFINEFNFLIEDIKTNGYNKNYPIPINNNTLINGSHRLSICKYFKKKPHIQKINMDCRYYDFKFFYGMESKYKDHMALEAIQYNKNIRCMILYPNCKINNIISIINKYGFLFYQKNFILNKNGLDNLIKECYRGEDWIGGLYSTNSMSKTKLCNGENSTTIFLIDMYDINKLIQMKEECRKIFNKGKNSLHVSDHTEDTFRISSSVLNDNSIFFLNNGTNDISNNNKLNLQIYFNEVKFNKQFCLTSSLVMELFKIRNARDVDYINRNDYIIKEGDIGIHDKEWLKYYPTNKDDILFNPDNYFYFNGHKIITLNNVLKMKKNRNEEKDKIDISLINNFYANIYRN